MRRHPHPAISRRTNHASASPPNHNNERKPNNRMLGLSDGGSRQKRHLVRGSFLITCLALSITYVRNLKMFDLASTSIVVLSPEKITTGSEASGPQPAASDTSYEFDGASKFISLLRKAYLEKIVLNPAPHCQLKDNVENHEIRKYNRALEVDWIGRNMSSVQPTWSGKDTASCHFVALAFPPTDDVLDKALQSRTYVSAFHTVSQCNSFQWGADKTYTCLGNNFGGTLGASTPDGCVKESANGYQIMLWNQKNSPNYGNGSLSSLLCLKQFLHQVENEVGQRLNQLLDRVDLSAANLTHNNYLERRGYGEDGREVKGTINLNWNTRAFFYWSTLVLQEIPKINGALGSLITETTDQLLVTLREGRNSVLSKCVEELMPTTPSKNSKATGKEKLWSERGVHLKTTILRDLPSQLLRSFPGSLRGMLPPPPTAVYSTNAILGTVTNVQSEIYYPGCTPYWNSVSNVKNAFKETTKFSNITSADVEKPPHILRNEIIKSCSKSESNCLFPTYDLVLDVTQVYCGEFFHWMIEIWPRIAPFIDGLLSDGVPDFAIRVGCMQEQTFHSLFYDLAGLGNVTLIGHEPVFAKEVIIPTEGFSHSPLLNYWNLVAIRQKVMENLGTVIPQVSKKTVLLIVRDASRRGDASIFNGQFLKELKTGLLNHRVVTFRSSDVRMMACLECQARAFMQADVIIGSHGAGLSHILFARRGVAVLERIVSDGDSGLYSELAFLLGHKYFPLYKLAEAKVYIDIIRFADQY